MTIDYVRVHFYSGQYKITRLQDIGLSTY